MMKNTLKHRKKIADLTKEREAALEIFKVTENPKAKKKLKNNILAIDDEITYQKEMIDNIEFYEKSKQMIKETRQATRLF